MSMQDEYAGVARLYAALLDPVLRRTRSRVRAMAGGLQASSVLDICCGTGALCRDLAADGLDATGVDLSGAMLAEARRRSRPSLQVRYISADARDLPFPGDAFDAAVMSLCLHENEAADRLLLLAEASRVARSVILVDYGADRGVLGPFVHLPERLAGRRHYEAFRNFVARGALEGLLESAGWTVLERRRVLLGAGICVLARSRRNVGASD